MTSAGPVCRVLVVDDEPMLRNVLVALLEASGYGLVGPACDAREAIDLATSERPDVVLMDMRMPGMSGIEATPLVLEACPTARVVLLTGFGQDILGPAAEAAGAYACLQKGDSWPQIRSTLESIMALQRSEHDAGPVGR